MLTSPYNMDNDDQEEEDLARRLRNLNRRLQTQLTDFDELALEEIDNMLVPEPTTIVNGRDVTRNVNNNQQRHNLGPRARRLYEQQPQGQGRAARAGQVAAGMQADEFRRVLGLESQSMLG